MTTAAAKQAIKKLNTEAFSLTPSALITLFEIDASDVAFDVGLSDPNSPNNGTIFRFHNNVKLGRNNVFWQGVEYVAAPIQGEGFEMKTQGTFPTPTLSLSVSDDGIQLLAIIKERLRDLDDLLGAKVTRIRTFAKYIDAVNFSGEALPPGFSPDSSVEFPRDIYYIEQKAHEDKFSIQFLLSSILDTEGLQLPARRVLADACTWTYRGCGCMYEYDSRREVSVHGKAPIIANAPNYSNGESLLPNLAPAVTNQHGEKITEILGVALSDKGLYEKGHNYEIGDQVYIQKNRIKYYFVCKVATSTIDPPNITYWIQDVCTHRVTDGCKLRWSKMNNGLGIGMLPFGGFPSVGKLDR